MIGGRCFVAGRKKHHFVGVTVDKINVSGKIVAGNKAFVGRTGHMPEATARFGLTSDDHFAGIDVDNAQTGWFFARSAIAPGRILSRIGTCYISTGKFGGIFFGFYFSSLTRPNKYS